jgi:hypothetical protein
MKDEKLSNYVRLLQRLSAIFMQARDFRERIGDGSEDEIIKEELRPFLTSTGGNGPLNQFTTEELLDELFPRELT